jgi:hypothetical protein
VPKPLLLALNLLGGSDFSPRYRLAHALGQIILPALPNTSSAESFSAELRKAARSSLGALSITSLG